uniref:C2H2-type domain-containing protein n=1 Tax=Caenorhabditis tropicalis TaxID=1561998 RepID=A0A1I7TYQ7_9PELO
MELQPGLREEVLRKFFGDGGKILTARQLDRFQLQITAVSKNGRLLRGVLDQKSRLNRELIHREKYETPYIVELPGDHSEDTEFIRYSVSLPRKKRVIALRYEEQTASTSTESKPKAKRIRTAAQLLGDTEDFCCRAHIRQHEEEENRRIEENNKKKRLAIEQTNMDEIRKKAEESVDKLHVPYAFGAYL